jgi:hypothetical protein
MEVLQVNDSETKQNSSEKPWDHHNNLRNDYSTPMEGIEKPHKIDIFVFQENKSAVFRRREACSLEFILFFSVIKYLGNNLGLYCMIIVLSL